MYNSYEKHQARQMAFPAAAIMAAVLNAIEIYNDVWSGRTAVFGFVVGVIVYAVVYMIRYWWLTRNLIIQTVDIATPETADLDDDLPDVSTDNGAVQVEARSMLSAGTTQIVVPEEVSVENAQKIMQSRQSGELLSVTLRGLDEIGISRFRASSPNAQSVIEWMQRRGLIAANGEWTELGNQIFPSPTATQKRSGVSGVTRVTPPPHHSTPLDTTTRGAGVGGVRYG